MGTGRRVHTDSAQLLAAREPTVEEDLNRHLCAAQEWMPREYVPSSLGP